jgi:hypothetical protein
MKKIIIACLALGVFVSCNKEVTELPPITQTGAHTFGAKVDGELFVPRGFASIPDDDILEGRFLPNDDLYINARNFASSPNEKEFELFIKGVTAPGTYQLNSTTPGNPNQGVSYGYYVKRNLTPENEWITNPSYTGTVTITKIDTVNNFVSGTFQFNAINMYGTPQPLSVTEGRFDVKTN